MDELDLIPEPERAEAAQLAARLRSSRPVPAPTFRGELHRRLLAVRAGILARLTPRARLALALTTAVAGGALLLLAAIGVAGGGPLAA